MDPSRIGEMTYAQVIAIVTKGKPEQLHRELWQARQILSDHAAGILVWQDEDANGKAG